MDFKTYIDKIYNNLSEAIGNFSALKSRVDLGLDIYIYVENKRDALSFYNFLNSKRNFLMREKVQDINEFYENNPNNKYLTFRIYKDGDYYYGRLQSYYYEYIKNLKGFISYPENNNLIFRLLEIIPPRYNKRILESTEHWPYRFKTKEEFEKEYGPNWRNRVTFNSGGGMDYLCGTILEQDFPKDEYSIRLNGARWMISRDMLTDNIIPPKPNYLPKKKRLL